ncbi:hypothetical protein ACFST9_21880 [Hymenobacter monticola]|uniref:MotA/TolQ/ExbB proton channel domain-containing protein n=1 Tax=Hymenobacter monticola TaxID=1705399 RepID=A0ABY4B534_9BACT|nr:hypothetical protein [Hymenobacter monticola]UOE34248.1 hypothetical protein MTP16_01025 [Hymenobacter monticola]
MFLVEILLILALVAWQAVVFLRNRLLIGRIQGMYPAAGAVGVQPIPYTAAQPEKNFEVQYDALIANNTSPEFGQIITDTNEYLLNNRGAAADFGILKDISERHAEALDDEIQAQITTPLYLGLLGTFTGAIIGLVSLVGNPFADVAANPNTDTSFSNGDVQHFLGGVLIAMIGSLFGLAFTLAGNQLLKQARAVRDRQKNAYYTFLQKALLPKLNSDMQAGMSNLKSVLDSFNAEFFSQIQNDFFSKIHEFTPLIASITENVSVQKRFLEQLEKIGYSELANATVKVFDRVDESAQTFEKFLGYQQALNTTVVHSTEAAQTIGALLNRLTALEQGLASVPQYLQQHDDALRQQVAFFSQHGKLLADLGAQIRQGVSEGVHRMDAELDGRLQELQKEASAAHEQWQQHFRRLNQDNIYQKITEYLNPFTQLPAQQKDLNLLQERQAQQTAQAMQRLEGRLVVDSQVQQELLKQVDRTNKVLEELTKPNWFQRNFLGKK